MSDQNMLKEKIQEVKAQIEKARKLFEQKDPSAATEMKKGLKLVSNLFGEINSSMAIILKKIRAEHVVENPLDTPKRIIEKGITKPEDKSIRNVVFPTSKYLN